MSSIVGDKWHNATASDIAAIDLLISNKTAELNSATTLLSQALTAINRCGNNALGCVNKTGRHISTWREQRDFNTPLVERFKNELYDLQERRATLVKEMGDIAVVTTVTAEANKAIAEAESVQTTSSAKKWLLYGGIGLVVIIAGVFIYMKLKHKK